MAKNTETISLDLQNFTDFAQKRLKQSSLGIRSGNDYAQSRNPYLQSSILSTTEATTKQTGMFPEDFKKKFEIPDPDLHYHTIPTPQFATSLNNWNGDAVTSAMTSFELGVFAKGSQYSIAMQRQNPIIFNGLNLRINTLFGLNYIFEQNKLGNKYQTKKILKIVEKYWTSHFFNLSTMKLLKWWELMIGVAPSQIIWEKVKDDDGKVIMLPKPLWMDPFEMYYQQIEKRFYINTLEGTQDIFPNDPRFLVWNGEKPEERPWIQGLVRPLSNHECMRVFQQMDLARFSQLFTVPLKKVFVPAEVSPAIKQQIQAQLIQVSNEATIFIPEYLTDKQEKQRMWDVEYVFPQNNANIDLALKNLEKLDDDMEICIQGRLTTNKASHFQNKDSSSGIRQDLVESDAKSLENFLKRLIDKFVALNWGDDMVNELSPTIKFNTEPPIDLQNNALALSNLSNSLEQLQSIALNQGLQIDYKQLLTDYKIPLIEQTISPVKIEQNKTENNEDPTKTEKVGETE